MARKDGLIVNDAKIALSAIAQRDNSVNIPENLSSLSGHIQQIEPTGNAYVDSCFNIDFQEIDEDRDSNKIDEFRQVMELGMIKGSIEKQLDALGILNAISQRYMDYDVFYTCKAKLFENIGGIDDARKAIQNGFLNAKKKYSLCDQMAQLEFDYGSLEEAVKWWIKSIVAQVSIGQIDLLMPFLYLSYIASALGDNDSSTILIAEVDKIQSRQIRLNSNETKKVVHKVAKGKNPSMRIAIERLCKIYLSLDNPKN